MSQLWLPLILCSIPSWLPQSGADWNEQLHKHNGFITSFRSKILVDFLLSLLYIKCLWFIFTELSTPQNRSRLTGGVVSEWRIGRNLDETSPGLIATQCRHIPRESEENNDILSQDSRCSNRDSNRTPPKYEFRALPLHESAMILYVENLIDKLILPAILRLKILGLFAYSTCCFIKKSVNCVPYICPIYRLLLKLFVVIEINFPL